MGKVLVYALSDSIGGVEEYILNLSRYNVEKNKYEYIVLGNSTPYENELKRLGVKYYYIPQKQKILKNILGLQKVFKESRKECEIIYFNTSALCYPIPYLLAKIYNYKIVLHSHLTGISGIRKFIHVFNRSWICRLCSVKMSCSTPAAKWMFGKSAQNVHIIPNAIDIERFKHNVELRFELRKQLGIDENEIVIGHIGRMTKVKNQMFLLNLISETKRQKLNYKLLLVGDGEDEIRLKRRVLELGIEKDVIFAGRTDKPEDLMNCIDCFVMPSLVEGFPIVLVEAQAAGLPCIVSECITKEVNISGNVKFLSLDFPMQTWIKCIENVSKEKYDCKKILRKHGYDVSSLGQLVESMIENI